MPEWDHLIKLPLYQSVSFFFIQPFPTWEGLLYPCEWTVHHHLQKIIDWAERRATPERHHFPLSLLSARLLTVPPGTEPIIVVPYGDSAEGAEEGGNLNHEDVRQPPLKATPLQKHLQKKVKNVIL